MLAQPIVQFALREHVAQWVIVTQTIAARSKNGPFRIIRKGFFYWIFFQTLKKNFTNETPLFVLLIVFRFYLLFTNRKQYGCVL